MEVEYPICFCVNIAESGETGRFFQTKSDRAQNKAGGREADCPLPDGSSPEAKKIEKSFEYR